MMHKIMLYVERGHTWQTNYKCFSNHKLPQTQRDVYTDVIIFINQTVS